MDLQSRLFSSLREMEYTAEANLFQGHIYILHFLFTSLYLKTKSKNF